MTVDDRIRYQKLSETLAFVIATDSRNYEWVG